jgi:hypothetical protein
MTKCLPFANLVTSEPKALAARIRFSSAWDPNSRAVSILARLAIVRTGSGGPAMSMGGKIAVIIGGIILLAFVFRDTDKQPNADPTDLVQNKSFLAENPTFVETTRKLILAQGYDCPKIDFLWVKGPSPFGTKLEALCGADDADRVYVTLHYAIYSKNAMVVTCKPWDASQDTCD